MHREEDHTRRKRFPIFDHGDQILERSQFDTTQTESLGGKGQNRAPELFPRRTQSDDHHGAGLERTHTVAFSVYLVRSVHETIVYVDTAALQLGHCAGFLSRQPLLNTSSHP